MSRIRVAIGLVAVAAGSAWFATRAGGLRASGEVMLEVAPYIIVLAGLMLLLRAAAPKGAMAGPLLVVLAGGLWLAIDRGALATGTPGREHLLPAALVLFGAVVAFVPANRNLIDTGVIRTGSVLFPAERYLSGMPPKRLALFAAFTSVTIDLTRMTRPVRLVEIDLTVLFGRIELVIPKDWTPLVPGEVALTRAIRFDGQLDADRRSEDSKERKKEIVLGIIGLLGAVRIRRVEPVGLARSTSQDAHKGSPEAAL